MIRRHSKGARRRRRRELWERRSQGIFLLPSLLTTANLFCGFFAMVLTVEGRYTEAVLAIYVAMVMDLLDGRVARLMKATSQFGVEFDSLADVVSFCVAPGFLVYSFALSQRVDDALAALTLEQVNAAWRRYIDPARLVMVWGGDFKPAP